MTIQSKLKNQLKNWINELNQARDAEYYSIKKSKENIESYSNAHQDITDLIQYMETHTFPLSVHRALQSCLKWNPYIK